MLERPRTRKKPPAAKSFLVSTYAWPGIEDGLDFHFSDNRFQGLSHYFRVARHTGAIRGALMKPKKDTLKQA